MGERIARRDLPAVVKRAAELAALEGEAEEELPEEEVIRIAAEVGLSARHVRQALLEGTREEPEPTFLDQQLGTPRVLATRAVPMTADRARRLLEDYLVTREYFQVVRKQGASLSLTPAEDTFSKIARSWARSHKHYLAAAKDVELTVRDLESGWSHVRLRAEYPDVRKAHVAGATAGTVLVGVPAAVGSGIGVAVLTSGLADPISAALGAVAGLGVLAGATTGFWAIARNKFRQWRKRTDDEINGVLDRLEKGDELRPPPAPWLRKLQLKFGRL